MAGGLTLGPGARARRESSPRLDQVAVIAAGGALGALGRYGLGQAFPTPAGGFPWTTFAVNSSGCLLLGALMVLIGQMWSGRPLIRPFLGVGVLGGFTTFSSYVIDIHNLVGLQAAGPALGYLAGTVLTALAATALGAVAANQGVARFRRRVSP